MGRETGSAGLKRGRRVAAKAPLVEVGQFFTDGVRLFEVFDVEGNEAVLLNAGTSLEFDVSSGDMGRVAIENLLGEKWRRVTPAVPDGAA